METPTQTIKLEFSEKEIEKLIAACIKPWHKKSEWVFSKLLEKIKQQNKNCEN